MPSIKDESTVEALARAFTSNGRNRGKALRIIGYAESTCISGKALEDIYGHLRVKAAIARIDAKTEEKLDLSRAGQHAKLETAIQMALDAKNPAAYISGVREQNEMLGYHRDKAPNQEKVDEILARMTDEEIATRRIVAKMRTDALSGPKLNKEIA